MPFSNVDPWIVRSLNHWGRNEIFLVKVLSEYLVYLLLFLAVIGFLYSCFRRSGRLDSKRIHLKEVFLFGIKLFVIPVGLATALSEIISSIYVRQRPFVTMRDVKLLVPHRADGGMPSHHMVFMFSLATMVFSINRRLSLLLTLISFASGIGRISAGIQYPSDVLAGALLGGVVALFYTKMMVRAKKLAWS
jgi:membrane-associated phospholipid phosphatase